MGVISAFLTPSLPPRKQVKLQRQTPCRVTSMKAAAASTIPFRQPRITNHCYSSSNLPTRLPCTWLAIVLCMYRGCMRIHRASQHHRPGHGDACVRMRCYQPSFQVRRLTSTPRAEAQPTRFIFYFYRAQGTRSPRVARKLSVKHPKVGASVHVFIIIHSRA